MGYLTYRWTNTVLLFYTTYISVDLAHHEVFHSKVGKGGIRKVIFGLSVRLRPWFVCASSEGSDESVNLDRLVFVFTARICDKYRIISAAFRN